MTTIKLTYFKKPITKEIIGDVWTMWLDGFNKSLIAQACNISTNKVSKIINDPNNEIPEEWQVKNKKIKEQQ